jgi:hypothetical protein
MRCGAAVQSPLVPSNPADIPQALLAAPTVAKSLAGVTVAIYVLGQLIPSIESVLAIKVCLLLNRGLFQKSHSAFA